MKKIVLVSPSIKDKKVWIEGIKKNDPSVEVEVYPDDTERDKTEFLWVWNAPEGIYKKYPNLKVVASITAGIDHILRDPDFPDDVILTRTNDLNQKKDMAVFVLSLILNHTRRLDVYADQQLKKIWKSHPYRRPEEVTVGIMGLGNIGQEIGKLLVANNFKVTGWSASKKDLEAITSYHGPDQKEEFLKTASVLVVVLPLTSETQEILNLELFKKLPEHAYLINIGRGRLLVEKDLETALKEGFLSGAALDVFAEEPLPENHPFWENEKIVITPHTANRMIPESVGKKVAENLNRMISGKDLLDTVVISKGY